MKNNNKRVVYKVTTIAGLVVALGTTGILSSTQAEASSLPVNSALLPKPCITSNPPGVSVYYARIVSAEPQTLFQDNPKKLTIIGEASGPCKISSIRFTWYLNGESFGSATYTGSTAKSSFTLLPNHVTQYIEFSDKPCASEGNDIYMKVDFSDGTDRSANTKIKAISWCPA